MPPAPGLLPGFCWHLFLWGPHRPGRHHEDLWPVRLLTGLPDRAGCADHPAGAAPSARASGTHRVRHDQVDHALLVVALPPTQAVPLVLHLALLQRLGDGDVGPGNTVIHGKGALGAAGARPSAGVPTLGLPSEPPTNSPPPALPAASGPRENGEDGTVGSPRGCCALGPSLPSCLALPRRPPSESPATRGRQLRLP